MKEFYVVVYFFFVDLFSRFFKFYKFWLFVLLLLICLDSKCILWFLVCIIEYLCVSGFQFLVIGIIKIFFFRINCIVKLFFMFQQGVVCKFGRLFLFFGYFWRIKDFLDCFCFFCVFFILVFDSIYFKKEIVVCWSCILFLFKVMWGLCNFCSKVLRFLLWFVMVFCLFFLFLWIKMLFVMLRILLRFFRQVIGGFFFENFRRN